MRETLGGNRKHALIIMRELSNYCKLVSVETHDCHMCVLARAHPELSVNLSYITRCNADVVLF